MDDYNVSKLEMTGIINEKLSVDFSDTRSSGSTSTPARQHQQHNSKSRDFLRHVRLLVPSALIHRAFAWTLPDEQRKIAIYSSRRMAVFNSIIHVLPLSGAITLLVLYWTRLWIGGSTDHGTTLQFVAKFHEILMQASLIDVLLCVVRALALYGYVPLGALSGAAQAPQLSYLWSLDFVATVMSRRFAVWNKVAFVLSMSGLLLMTASVGPSSAILMIPRSGMLYISSITRYLDVTEATLFPTLLNMSSSPYFPTYHHPETQVLETGVIGERRYAFTAWLSDAPDIAHGLGRLMRYIQAYEVTAGGSIIDFAIATTPTGLSIRQLSQNMGVGEGSAFLNRVTSNANWTLTTWQPLVMIACTPIFDGVEDAYYVREDGSQRPLKNLPNLMPIIRAGNRLNMTKGPLISSVWTPLPEASHALIGAFFNNTNLDDKTFYTESRTDSRGFLQICTMSSYWRHTTTTLQVKRQDLRASTDVPVTREALLRERLNPIVIELSVALSLSEAFSNDDTGNITEVGVQSLVPARYLANALAWIPGRLGTYDKHNGSSALQMEVEKKFVMGYNGSDLDEASLLSQFEVNLQVHGYGYGYVDTATQLALAVMIAYCSIIVLYITYTIITGHSSIAWDSATELIMLALQSRTPDHLGHVSVGVDSMNTFQEQVGIRVKTVRLDSTGELDERLELVFARDIDNGRRETKLIERNKAY